MPAASPEQLVQAVADAIAESGYVGTLASPAHRNPRRFIITGQNAPAALTVYALTLTFGGRPSLRNEYRIQMTAVRSPLEIARDGPTILDWLRTQN
jgi:putative restriction endonuclease